jgi:hypothetical protein
VAVAKKALPLPPRPPRATTIDWPLSSTSPSSSRVSASRTTVPGGTGSTTSAPDRPDLLEPEPWSPRSAVQLSRYV